MKLYIIFFLSILSLTIYSLEGFETLKKEYDSMLDKKYILLPHNGTYLLPLSYNFKPNTKSFDVITETPEFSDRGTYNKKLEAEFQISFMLLTTRNIFSTDFNIFVGYTHKSWWQVYNGDWSRQFRETNYAPEVFARKLFSEPKPFLGGKIVAYDFGFIHQSNGQIQELSRSWNRIFFRSALVYGNTFIKTSFWYRIPDPLDVDENKDITDYIGHGEIEVDQVWTKSRLQLRIIPGMKYQGAELTYSYPLHEGLRYFLKAGYGYGLSLIDYKTEGQRIGIGVTLSDLLSQ